MTLPRRSDSSRVRDYVARMRQLTVSVGRRNRRIAELREKTYNREQLRTAAFMGAGAGAGAVMEMVGHVVLPTEEIQEAVEEILRDFFEAGD